MGKTADLNRNQPFLVRVTGFEPAASCSQSRRPTNWATPGYLLVTIIARIRRDSKFSCLWSILWSKPVSCGNLRGVAGHGRVQTDSFDIIHQARRARKNNFTPSAVFTEAVCISRWLSCLRLTFPGTSYTMHIRTAFTKTAYAEKGGRK